MLGDFRRVHTVVQPNCITTSSVDSSEFLAFALYAACSSFRLVFLVLAACLMAAVAGKTEKA